MTQSPILVETGCILKRSNVGEADKILTILTKKHGKLRVMAKGIRKISSRRGPHLDVFNIVKITLHQGKGITQLSEALSIFSGRLSYTSWMKMRAAYVVVEVVDKLIPEHEPQEQVFELTVIMLEDIGKKRDEEIEILLVRFLNTLLSTLGFISFDKPIVDLPRLLSFTERVMERKIRSSRFFLVQ